MMVTVCLSLWRLIAVAIQWPFVILPLSLYSFSHHFDNPTSFSSFLSTSPCNGGLLFSYILLCIYLLDTFIFDKHQFPDLNRPRRRS